MDKIEVLKRSDLFRELDDEQLDLVAEMGTQQVFDAGTIIHKQGAVAELIHVVSHDTPIYAYSYGQSLRADKRDRL